MSLTVGTITKMWCEECEKEFSFKQYADSEQVCPFCGNEDVSWDSPDAQEIEYEDGRGFPEFEPHLHRY